MRRHSLARKDKWRPVAWLRNKAGAHGDVGTGGADKVVVDDRRRPTDRLVDLGDDHEKRAVLLRRDEALERQALLPGGPLRCAVNAKRELGRGRPAHNIQLILAIVVRSVLEAKEESRLMRIHWINVTKELGHDWLCRVDEADSRRKIRPAIVAQGIDLEKVVAIKGIREKRRRQAVAIFEEGQVATTSKHVKERETPRMACQNNVFQ